MLQSLDEFDRIDDGYGEFSDNPEEAEDPEEGFSNLVDGADAILLEDGPRNSHGHSIFRIDGLVRQKGVSTVEKVWEVANDRYEKWPRLRKIISLHPCEIAESIPQRCCLNIENDLDTCADW